MVIDSRKLTLIVILTVISFTPLLLYILFYSPLFQIRTVKITAHADIFSNVKDFQKRQNIFFVSADKIHNQLLNNPLIESATIKKQLPSTLEIDVVERKPVAQYMSSQIYLVDRRGKIIPNLPRFLILNYPTILCSLQNVEIGSVIGNENFVKSLTLIDWMSGNGLTPTSVKCLKEATYEIQVEKTVVIFNSTQDQSQLESSLLFLFKQFRIEGKLPERVDMRFEKPVIIPKSG